MLEVVRRRVGVGLLLRDEPRPVGAHRVAHAALGVVPGDEDRARRAPLDGERRAAERHAVLREVVRQVRAVRVVVNGAREVGLRERPGLGERAVGVAAVREHDRDGDVLALVRVAERVPRGLRDGMVDERRGGRREEALVLERGLAPVDVDGVVSRLGRPLQERGEQSPRPHRLVVRVEPRQRAVGLRRSLEYALRPRGDRPSDALAADAAVAAHVARDAALARVVARGSRAGVAAVRRPAVADHARPVLDEVQAHRQLRRDALAAVRGRDVGRTSDEARGAERPRRGHDGPDLAAVDGERRGDRLPRDRRRERDARRLGPVRHVDRVVRRRDDEGTRQRDRAVAAVARPGRLARERGVRSRPERARVVTAGRRSRPSRAARTTIRAALPSHCSRTRRAAPPETHMPRGRTRDGEHAFSFSETWLCGLRRDYARRPRRLAGCSPTSAYVTSAYVQVAAGLGAAGRATMRPLDETDVRRSTARRVRSRVRRAIDPLLAARARPGLPRSDAFHGRFPPRGDPRARLCGGSAGALRRGSPAPSPRRGVTLADRSRPSTTRRSPSTGRSRRASELVARPDERPRLGHLSGGQARAPCAAAPRHRGAHRARIAPSAAPSHARARRAGAARRRRRHRARLATRRRCRRRSPRASRGPSAGPSRRAWPRPRCSATPSTRASPSASSRRSLRRSSSRQARGTPLRTPRGTSSQIPRQIPRRTPRRCAPPTRPSRAPSATTRA